MNCQFVGSVRLVSVKLSAMVRSNGQPATNVRASSIGARNNQANRACRAVLLGLDVDRNGNQDFSRDERLLPVAAMAEPLQCPGKISQVFRSTAIARKRFVDLMDEFTGDLVIASTRHRSRADGGRFQDVDIVAVERINGQ